MLDVAPRTALITGAGSGIGRELARLFAQDGHNLVIVGRAESALRDMAETLRARHQIRVTVLGADPFDPGTPFRVHEQVRARGIFVSYLVNDAGHGACGPFAQGELEQDLDVVQLNVVAVVTLTKLFLRDMLARNEGRVLQLVSMAGRPSAPLSAVCSGSRAFVLGFAEAVAEELRGSNVTMSALLPGAGAEAPGRIARDGYRALMLGRPANAGELRIADLARGLASSAEQIVVAPAMRPPQAPKPSKAGQARH